MSTGPQKRSAAPAAGLDPTRPDESRVRLVCRTTRRQLGLWGGGAVLAAAAVVLALGPTAPANQVGAAVAAVAGVTLLVWGIRHRRPVLEADGVELRYIRGRYTLRIPFHTVGSYYVVSGRTRALGLCDASGQPCSFPSIEGRRTRRPYLPLTRSVSDRQIEEFMRSAGIPPRNRFLTAGSGHTGRAEGRAGRRPAHD